MKKEGIARLNVPGHDIPIVPISLNIRKSRHIGIQIEGKRIIVALEARTVINHSPVRFPNEFKLILLSVADLGSAKGELDSRLLPVDRMRPDAKAYACSRLL